MNIIKSSIKNKKIFCLVFILHSLQFIGQDNKSISFIKKGKIEKITERHLSTYLEKDSLISKTNSKFEYFFNQDGLMTKKIDSLFNTVTYYYYTKKNFCEKQITKSENKIKFTTILEKTDTCIISKTFDSLSVLLFTNEIKVNDRDKIIYQNTRTVNGYIEILTSDYNENMLPINSTYWSEGMDFKTEIHYKDETKDKYGNWTKCISSSDMLFRERTILIREIKYRK